EQVVEQVYRRVQERTQNAGGTSGDDCGGAAPETVAVARLVSSDVERPTSRSTQPQDVTSRATATGHQSVPDERERWHRVKVPWYWVARFACRVFCATFFRLHVYGRENVPREGAYILAGNHQSYLDPVFCGVGIRRRLTFVARDTLFRYRLSGWLLHSVNAIPIERGRPDISAIKTFIARLRQGEAVCLYPEATRTNDGRIIPFKPGFGLLCRRAKAAVVPVLVDGAFECWPRHRKLFRPGRITIWYGKTLYPETLRTMSNEDLADHLTATLRQMQTECRLKQGKQPYDYGVKFEV
ncbi:MAG: 1-acyl-sn-glycerol-3-phosphate acyltransferase, partial [Planctomycetes bacterium]|nr:1-acyl-sn-glycerol-3-phosphate acyltransferase [Planctomycetota bacterium]